ncbi:MAG: hypothetical protein HY903_06925 [Deltaproteobacteria bacterium]|nr:hypothetical protein [Deltaproteobacteria bacterium]
MQTLEEHAQKDPSKDYCCHCAKPPEKVPEKVPGTSTGAGRSRRCSSLTPRHCSLACELSKWCQGLLRASVPSLLGNQIEGGLGGAGGNGGSADDDPADPRYPSFPGGHGGRGGHGAGGGCCCGGPAIGIAAYGHGARDLTAWRAANTFVLGGGGDELLALALAYRWRSPAAMLEGQG